MKPDFAKHLVEGVRLFNAGKFWHAHESWETLWLEAESEVRDFLQGLIQVAAAHHHVQRGNERGAGRLFRSGMRRLERYPAQYCDLDRSAIADRDHPELILLATTPAPPLVQW